MGLLSTKKSTTLASNTVTTNNVNSQGNVGSTVTGNNNQVVDSAGVAFSFGLGAHALDTGLNATNRAIDTVGAIGLANLGFLAAADTNSTHRFVQSLGLTSQIAGDAFTFADNAGYNAQQSVSDALSFADLVSMGAFDSVNQAQTDAYTFADRTNLEAFSFADSAGFNALNFADRAHDASLAFADAFGISSLSFADAALADSLFYTNLSQKNALDAVDGITDNALGFADYLTGTSLGFADSLAALNAQTTDNALLFAADNNQSVIDAVNVAIDGNAAMLSQSINAITNLQAATDLERGAAFDSALAFADNVTRSDSAQVLDTITRWGAGAMAIVAIAVLLMRSK